MKIRELPEWEMPREKLLRYGKESLSNAELLAIILRSGAAGKSALELAGELMSLDRLGLRHLTECSPEELAEIKGMGEAKICQVLAAAELGKRIAASPAGKRGAVSCPADVAGLVMEKLRYEKREHFLCVLLNSKGEILEETEISVGDLNSSYIHPREVFARAVKRSAGSMLLIHNHPSGDPSPSGADIETTERLLKAGDLLGIPIVDHIIIGDGTFFSMKENGQLTLDYNSK